jgi:GNAT superfamily N-acetyltransferase
MSSEITIRPARAAELDALGALQLRSSLGWGEQVEALLAMPEAGQVPAEHVPTSFVAEVSGRMVGFGTVLRTDAAEAELEGLFVEPGDWGQGVGARLVAEAERRAAALGVVALRVVASRRAEAFYLACGFETVGEVMTQLEPAPVMRKLLAG